MIDARRIVRRLEAPPTRRTAIALAAALAVLVVVLALCAVALGVRADAVGERERADELREQAPAAVAAVFTVHEKSWKQDRFRARDHLAAPLAGSLSAALAVGPPDEIASIVWEPLRTAVVDVDADAGVVLTTVRVSVTPKQGPAEVRTTSVQANLTRSGDRWLVNGLDEL
ncbi:hypothetical protein [Gordonia zhaorongruii]|nr:hypothetical protein [Gordonia zhaorongruii]